MEGLRGALKCALLFTLDTAWIQFFSYKTFWDQLSQDYKKMDSGMNYGTHHCSSSQSCKRSAHSRFLSPSAVTSAGSGGLLGGMTKNLNTEKPEHWSICPSQAMAATFNHSVSKLGRGVPREAQVVHLGTKHNLPSPHCVTGASPPLSNKIHHSCQGGQLAVLLSCFLALED